MQVIMVEIIVKTDNADAFMKATLANARASLGEQGVIRFDVVRDATDPRRFVLVEAYRDAEGSARHKETAHYLEWKQTVEPMMAAPRTRRVFDGVFVPESK